LIFVIDGYDQERFEEAKEYLLEFLKLDTFKDATVLVLINKIDLGCMSVAEISEKFELNKHI